MDCPCANNPGLENPCPKGLLCLGGNIQKRFWNAANAPVSNADLGEEFEAHYAFSATELKDLAEAFQANPGIGLVKLGKQLAAKAFKRIGQIGRLVGHPDACGNECPPDWKAAWGSAVRALGANGQEIDPDL